MPAVDARSSDLCAWRRSEAESEGAQVAPNSAGGEKHLERSMPILSVSEIGLEALLDAVDKCAMQSHGKPVDVAYMMGPNLTPGAPSGDSVLLFPRAEVTKALR